jgi:hypothetical protein
MVEMNAIILTDPEYQIVVAMAETLVPDVCRVIMDELECIWIKKGKVRWREAVARLNREYKKLVKEFKSEDDDGVVEFNCGFVYNYRPLEGKSTFVCSYFLSFREETPFEGD